MPVQLQITNHSKEVTMKRNFFKLLPILLVGFTLTLGCGKKMVSEDISSSAADANSGDVVSDERPATEPVETSDLPSGEASPAGGYASLSQRQPYRTS
jgi:hypothetical protein